MFQMDVANVDRDVAYVATVVDVCCKGLLPLFHLCFSAACCKFIYLDVAYVSMVVHLCWCLSPMFHLFSRRMCKCVYLDVAYMFHTYVASILSECYVCLQYFSSVFSCFFQVFQKHVSSVSSVFRSMLQVLHLDISKVEQMLHM